jgi:HEAT repeat protein
MGVQASSAVPKLIAQLNGKDPALREEAVRAIGRIGTSAEQSVPALIDVLSDKDPIIQYTAVESLGMYASNGPDFNRIYFSPHIANRRSMISRS